MPEDAPARLLHVTGDAGDRRGGVRDEASQDGVAKRSSRDRAVGSSLAQVKEEGGSVFTIQLFCDCLFSNIVVCMLDSLSVE